MSSPYSELYRRFRILPHDERLFDLAFTHPSCNSDNGTNHEDYERLEFLGDSVIGMVVADLCYALHPDMTEGGLTQIKNQFVRSSSEAELCAELGLDEYIHLGDSLGQLDQSIREDVFESFVGALYLDQGLEFVVSFLKGILRDRIARAEIILDPKSKLQQILQADGAVSIQYKVIEESGSAQDKHVISGVFFDGMELGRGEGHNKKAAEMEAARIALEKLAKPKEA